jgi:hypothetical protein
MSSYRDHYKFSMDEGCEMRTPTCTHSWQTYTEVRLAWIYGPERAQQIISGRDPLTQQDVAAWAQLGRRSAAA